MATIPEALAQAMQYYQAGNLAQAEQLYRLVLQVDPAEAGALHMLGVVAHQAGKHEEAVALIRQAVAVIPHSPMFHSNLGAVYAALGRWDEAAGSYAQAARWRPESPQDRNNLGHALKQLGRLTEAEASFRESLRLRPDFPEALSLLGDVLVEQGRFAEAEAGYREALRLRPDLHEAHNNLGNVLRLVGRLAEAEACYREALRLRPDLSEALGNLGLTLAEQGRPADALVCYREALRLLPDNANAAATHSSYLNALQYSPDVTLAGLRGAHEEYDRRHAARFRDSWGRHDNEPDPDRPLRVGFISPHFNHHPVGRFLIGALENLDRSEAKIVCYSDTKNKDDLTSRFMAAAWRWRQIRGKTDEELVQLVRADGIDILFDLAGHTGGNRMLAFARKPAPIQVTWLDYEGTTGLSAIDYLLADRYEVPPEAETWYVERILRMPDGFVCYAPPSQAPPVGPLPALTRGFVTFGSFNLVSKITPQVVATWARILQDVTGSRLFLKYKGLDDANTADRFRRSFADQGIAPTRVLLEGWSPYAEFLTRYQEIDIALDPFPYTGGLTTCEALWMGVPVVTCPGETFASRHGLSHLSNIGLTETIARDLDHYVELAVDLARNLSRLTGLRARLRQQMASSPLCDGRRFAANVMALLRGIWREWVDRQK
jgi:protein O-GlcNAc transferase